jgi:hypothetical protein
MAMRRFVRLAVIAYMVFLTLGLLAGQWYLEGPRLLGAGGHGVHAGDVVVVLATTVAAVALLLTARP